jgi:bloom syndrome protein
VDVTAECQEIVKCVKQICGTIGSRWSNNFTLLHMVDIFKGSDIKKIKEAGKIMLVFKLINHIQD